MIIGVPKEIKKDEYRVALVPSGVKELRVQGHRILIEKGAGLASGFPDQAYKQAGATLVASAKALFAKAELVLKVKEPQPKEFALLRAGQILFTFFHFAADSRLTQALLKRKVTCVAYETVEDEQGQLPILIPMSEVAGRMSVQQGAKYLERPFGGKGLLLGGIPGVGPANVLILGAGVVGMNAAKVAAGLGARVTMLDVNIQRLRYLEDVLPKNVWYLASNAHNIEDRLQRADLVIGAALARGAKSPVLMTRKMMRTMRPGSVLVDVAIDQGGCAETSRPTTHQKPTYVEEGIVHYCVTNIPGAVPATATHGLNNATLSFVKALANQGFARAMTDLPGLAKGVNLYQGHVTYEATAQALGLPYTSLSELL